MNQLISFAIEMLVLSAAFCLGFIAIRNHTTALFKRFYLLIWIILSFTFPLINIEFEGSYGIHLNQVIEASNQGPSFSTELRERLPESSDHATQESPTRVLLTNNATEKLEWESVLFMTYLLVVIFLIIRIAVGLIQIVKLKANAVKIEDETGIIYVVNNFDFKGASFFHWIFVGLSFQDNEVIIQHERLHSKLGHSFDILLSHFYSALFWINPFAWFIKKHIALNCEMQVDAKMLQSETFSDYTNTLLAITSKSKGPIVMNHFGAFNLRTRIEALSKSVSHKHWVTFLSTSLCLIMFFLISCEGVNSPEVMEERLNDVKTITTRFISHQNDTQQKTGKIVAMASFGVDGTLEELVEQTTYPYDREFEVKKNFWEAPVKSGIPYIMDGLSLGNAEKSFLYGHDWPSAYYKHLTAKSQSRDLPWEEIVEVDNEILPREISTKKEFASNEFIGFGMPDITEYFDYEDEKVTKVMLKSVYKNLEYSSERNKSLSDVVQKNRSQMEKEMIASMKESSGKMKLVATYEYDGELLTSIKYGEDERRFYYENDLMVRSEFLRSGEVINIRMHYYKNSLKDRTEIFNRYNEPEYTITYEYEFW